MSLRDLAQEALQNLTVEMRPLIPFNRPNWNVGELAVAHVRIINTTGAPLRDIDVETYEYGFAAEYVSGPDWDGNGATRQSLEPGQAWDCYPALLRGLSEGTIWLQVIVGAEVVPYATSPAYYASYNVLAQLTGSPASGNV